ncbi:MAG TPA: hypothetical protein VFC78_05925, partial [Tepidisphaeraceae bacterium]|nr:hypothetical protein [Tepidisphaeraceae bacterium]
MTGTVDATHITDAEKKARRDKVLAKRAKRAKDKPKLPPLPRRKRGADQRYKEFKVVQFHDEAVERPFGENNPAGQQWATQVMHEVKHEGYGPFWDRLPRWRGTQRRGPRRQEADRVLNYVSTRKEMIVYDTCKHNGWRISSSTTESEC